MILALKPPHTTAYSGLVAYAQVFIQSAALYSSMSAYAHGLIFAMAVIPLSCVDLLEQAVVQVAMAVLRFAALAVMFAASTAALVEGGPGSADPDSRGVGFHAAFVNWDGFSLIFSTALFSQLYQHSVPGLLHPLSLDDRRESARTVFASALFTTATLYILTGCLCAAAFGEITLHTSDKPSTARPCATTFTNPTHTGNGVLSAVNLNFYGFQWGYEDGVSPPPSLVLTSDLAVRLSRVFRCIATTCQAIIFLT